MKVFIIEFHLLFLFYIAFTFTAFGRLSHAEVFYSLERKHPHATEKHLDGDIGRRSGVQLLMIPQPSVGGRQGGKIGRAFWK